MRLVGLKVSLRVSFSRPVKKGEHPLEPALRLCSKLGFDGIELCLEPEIWATEGPVAWSPSLDVNERAKIRKVADSHGLEIASLSSDWAWGYSTYSPKLKYWQRGMEVLKEDIRLAEDLGAKAILVHFGTSQAQSWQQAKDMIQELAEEGEIRGVKVGFEGGIWARIGLGGLKELCQMVDEVGSKWFGVYEHCYWPRGTTRPHEEIELVKDRIVCLHSGRIDAKNTDYDLMLKALKKHYDWYWVFEVEMSEAEENIKSWREIMRRHW